MFKNKKKNKTWIKCFRSHPEAIKLKIMEEKLYLLMGIRRRLSIFFFTKQIETKLNIFLLRYQLCSSVFTKKSWKLYPHKNLHVGIYRDFIYNCQNLQGTKMSYCRWTDKYTVVQFSSVTQSHPALWDPMNSSTPVLPVHQQLLESTQTHVHWIGVAIPPSHPLSSPSPPAFDLSQHQVFSNESVLHIRWPKY